MEYDNNVFNVDNLDPYLELKEKIKKYDLITNKHVFVSKSPTFCYECNIDLPIEDHKNGLYICSKCGVVVMQLIDTKNVFKGDPESMQNYININKYLPELSGVSSIKGLRSSTIIKTLHKWYKISPSQRTLNEKYLLIQDICTSHNLLKCVEDTAKILYTQLYYEKNNNSKNPIYRGNNYLGLIAICIWNSAMKYGINLYPKELAKMCNIDPLYLKKGEQIFNKLCRFKNFEMFEITHSYENYITRFCEILNIHNKYKEIAIKISKNVVKLKIFNSQQHISIAVGVIYTICVQYNLDLTKNDIAETFKISQGTILKTYKKFKPFIKILLDDSLTLQLEEKINSYQNKLLYQKNYILQSLKFNHYQNMDILHFNNIQDIYDLYVDVDITLNLEYHKIYSFYFYSL
jgi:transcription initiation factor TFIIIB Brf1 subunit/transcription initiation factor TFIIB